MADTSLQSRLKRLFSNNAIVRRVGKDKLKVVDTSNLQSTGNLSNTRYADRFAGLHTSKSGYLNTYNQTYNFHQSRVELFTDYEAMDTDPILASALDIYADECTVKDAENNLLTIKSPNNEIRKLLHNLFYDILNIDYNLWPWIRNMSKYGDFYLHLEIQEGIGVVNIHPISAYEMRREEMFDPENPNDVRFVQESAGGYGTTSTTKRVFENYEIAHFRLLSDTNFLPYGKSMLESARKIFKQLVLMEDAMLLSRIMRAPERRIFKIDVGNIPPNEVDQHMNNIINKMKKVPLMDEKTGDYNLKFNLMNMLEDYYLPVRGGESGTNIETLAGLSNEGQIEDIEYLRNKMMSALKIPKAFLGYDEGVEGKATLAAEDVRFARTIDRLQKIVVSELTKIAVVHLFTQGYTNEELIDFDLSLTSPSIIYEKQKVEILNEKMGLAQNMKESLMFSEQYIYETVFNLSADEWQGIQEQVIEDLKQDFRKEQIKSEGNDPTVTNQSFGTAHDIASMHVSTRNGLLPGQEKKNTPGPGRPKEYGTWGKHKDAYGRDPFGIKSMNNAFDTDKNPLQHKSRNEHIDIKNHTALINDLAKFTKSKTMLKESLSAADVNTDSGTFLDENNLINE
jgi:hypothetical protein